MPITRTLNPLPFTDLDPHRFEDLVRNLVYDFRSWKRLEATGRQGGDRGFDIRGVEGVWETREESDSLPEDDPSAEIPIEERVWLIQCKRERSIAPRQLERYLDQIPESERSKLYGIVFVACCNFSVRSRDVIASWCSSNGLTEFQLWGLGDLETMLMQPKNDHILFAFFGISLQIRRRSVSAALRSSIATKRKAAKILERAGYGPCLFRDPSDERFPYAPADQPPETIGWQVRMLRGWDYRGLAYEAKSFKAYLGAEGQWDVANVVNYAIPHETTNPWYDFEVPVASGKLFREVWGLVAGRDDRP